MNRTHLSKREQIEHDHRQTFMYIFYDIQPLRPLVVLKLNILVKIDGKNGKDRYLGLGYFSFFG